MAVAVTCPHCGRVVKLLENILGKTIRCPGCQKAFKTSPAPSPAQAAAPAPLPAAAEDLLDVLPAEPAGPAAAPAAVAAEPPAVLEALPADEDAGRPRRRSLPPGDTRPIRKRGGGAGLAIGIVAGVLILCGGGGTLAYFLGSRLLSRPKIPDSEWRAFRPDERCVLSMPGVPTPENFPRAAAFHATGLKFNLPLPRYNRAFSFASVDCQTGSEILRDGDPLGLFAGQENTFHTNSSGMRSIRSSRDVFNGIPGYTFRFEGPRSVLMERVVMARRTPTAIKFYVLEVEGPSLDEYAPEVTRFFDSLLIAPEPPAPAPPNPTPNPNPNPPPNPETSPPPRPRPRPGPTSDPNQLKLIADRLRIHPDGTCRVRYAPDGKTLAALGEDGVLKLVSLPDFVVRATLPAVAGPLHDLVYDRKGTLLAVVGDGVYLYDAAGKPQPSLPFKDTVAAAFSPTGDRLAVAVRKPDGGEVHFWDCAKRSRDGESLSFPAAVSDLAWSSDGTTLAVATGGSVRLLDPETRKERRTINAHHAPITGLAFAPDGRSLVTIGEDLFVKRWSSADGKLLTTYEGHASPTGRPEFSPDGNRLATFGGADDLSVMLWETATGRPLYTLVNAPAQTGNLSFRPDGQTLAMALRHQSVRFWNIGLFGDSVPAPRPVGKATRPEEAVRFNVPIAVRMVRFSPDGKTLAASGREGDLLICNVADWTLRAARKTPGAQGRAGAPSVTFAFSADGRLFAAGGSGGGAYVYLRDAVSGALLSDFWCGFGSVRCVAVSPDGRVVAVGSDSASPRRRDRPRADRAGVLRMWDVSGVPRLFGSLELPHAAAGLAFGPDGKILYAVAGAGVRRWLTATREELPALTGATGDLAALAVAPDGRVYAAGQDLLIHSWDAEGRPGPSLEGHRDAVTGLSLTGDGRRLASVSRDGTCRVWDTATGETVAVTEDRSQRLGVVATGLPAFSPDGTLLAVGADYNVVSVLRTDRLKGTSAPKAAAAKKPSKSSTDPGAVAAFDQVETYWFVNAAFADNHTLLTADNSGAVQWRDWPAGTLREERQHPSAVHVLARSNDGKLLALASGNAVYLRDAAGKLLATIRPPDADKHPFARRGHIALSPDGALLAMALSLGNDSEVVVWDVKESRQAGVVHTRSGPTSVAFSPDGKMLAVGQFSPGGGALYDPRALKEGKVVAQQKSGVRAVAFSPDGKALATSSDDGLVKLWDLAGDKELWSKPWSQANAWRQSVCFSPDGKLLVAAPLSARHGLVLVNAADGTLRTDVTRYPMPNSDPSFSPDGKYLAVVKKVPGQVVVYEVDRLLATAP